ncbi:MAG: cytochrome c3 family protein [Acidobacteriaceae bacterium]
MLYRYRLLPAVICAVLLFLFPLWLRGQQLDCLSCHGNPGMQDSSGHTISVAADTFHASVHGVLGCAACHSDIKTFPHPAKVAEVQCGTCHTQEASGLAGTVHAGQGAHSCLNCHGNPHAIVKVTDKNSPVYPLNIPHTCGACHGNAAFVKQHHLKNVYGEYKDSIHGAALTKDGLLVAANCSSCHGTHHILPRTNPESSTYRTNIPGTCGKCHAGIEEKYLAGTHGKAMLAGNKKAPVCTDCHTAHRISEPAHTAFQERTVGTCGGCHREKYATYRDTFHAQVSALGYTEVAHCWDCHGPHEVLPASDPQSPVNRANLVKTCGKCHSESNVKFVSYDPHADAYDFHSNPALFSIRIFMDLLLWSVLGFFAIHTILWFTRLQFARWRGRSAKGEDHE